jgi:serine/threonine protein kinase
VATRSAFSLLLNGSGGGDAASFWRKIALTRKTGMDKYEIRRRIGSGSFGSVYLAAQRVTGKSCVVKSVKTAGMTTRESTDVRQEVKVLSQLHHDNIVEYMDSFDDPRIE